MFFLGCPHMTAFMWRRVVNPVLLGVSLGIAVAWVVSLAMESV